LRILYGSPHVIARYEAIACYADRTCKATLLCAIASYLAMTWLNGFALGIAADTGHVAKARAVWADSPGQRQRPNATITK